LKDADYSTPQDHYFRYVSQNRAKLDDGMAMQELNKTLYTKELEIIQDLYEDQVGRATSIEAHIDRLRLKRKPKSMVQVFQELTETEKQDIEKNWGTTLEELRVLAERHDAQITEEAIPAEEKRSRRKDKTVLEKASMDKIMESAVTKRKIVEYQAENPYALKKEQLVKITPKSRKQQRQDSSGGKYTQEREEEI